MESNKVIMVNSRTLSCYLKDTSLFVNEIENHFLITISARSTVESFELPEGPVDSRAIAVFNYANNISASIRLTNISKVGLIDHNCCPLRRYVS